VPRLSLLLGACSCLQWTLPLLMLVADDVLLLLLPPLVLSLIAAPIFPY
jgi:hypothetical protein